jgi:hypothetical protein
MHSNEYYGFGTSADNAAFTGFYLAAASFRYGVNPKTPNLTKIEDTLKGLYLLTHISGTPGVLARLAFPLKDSYKRIGYVPAAVRPKPEGWGKGNTWWDRKTEGSMYESGTHFYYCRTTRDQLTGLVYGMSVAWNVLAQNNTTPRTEKYMHCIELIQTITRVLLERLERTNWSLEDHTGLIGRTNAHKPNYQLKRALIHLDQAVNNKARWPTSSRKLKRFYKYLWFHTFYYRFTRRMYAWNLRTAVAFSLWINEKDPELREGAFKWMKRIASFTKDEDNAFFVFTENAMINDVSEERIERAQERLDSLAKYGHNKFFAWQKPKGEADPNGTRGGYGPGIDVLLPYWIKKQKQNGI